MGDAFAKPILAALDAHPGRWDLSSLVGIISSGVMWSEETKQGLLRHHPGMLLVDAFSSSEAIGMGSSVSSGSSAAHTAQFTLGPEVRVLDADGRDVEPGTGQSGVLALGGRIPLGYYKDEAKTAATFRTIDGTRYSVPGDYAQVSEDGSIHLLGRGSVVHQHRRGEGLPRRGRGGGQDHPTASSTRWWSGSPTSGSARRSWPSSNWPRRPRRTGHRDVVIEHVKARLAGYKAPRRVRFVTTIGRSPSGKVDYARHRAETAEWAGVTVGLTAWLPAGVRAGQPLLAPWVRTKSLTV